MQKPLARVASAARGQVEHTGGDSMRILFLKSLCLLLLVTLAAPSPAADPQARAKAALALAADPTPATCRAKAALALTKITKSPCGCADTGDCGCLDGRCPCCSADLPAIR